MKYYCFLFFSVLTIAPAYSQPIPQDNHRCFWVNVGLGASTESWGGGMSLSYQADRHIFSFRFATVFSLFENEDSSHDFAVLYGLSRKRQRGFVSLSGGVSVVRSEYHDTCAGIAVETQLFLTPVSFGGFGIYGFGNLNAENPFCGALLCFQVGKTR